MQTVLKFLDRLTRLCANALAVIASTVILVACSSAPELNGSSQTGTAEKIKTTHPLISAEQCADAGGQVVGDIGDGSIHSPDYLCNNGTSPIGTINNQDEPVMTEGAVCCGT